MIDGEVPTSGVVPEDGLDDEGLISRFWKVPVPAPPRDEATAGPEGDPEKG